MTTSCLPDSQVVLGVTIVHVDAVLLIKKIHHHYHVYTEYERQQVGYFFLMLNPILTYTIFTKPECVESSDLGEEKEQFRR